MAGSIGYFSGYNGNENVPVTEEIRQYTLYVQQPDGEANNARTKLLLNNTVFLQGGTGITLPGAVFQSGAPVDILNNVGGLTADQLPYNAVQEGRFDGSVPKKLSFFLDNTYDGTVTPTNAGGAITTIAGDMLIFIKNSTGDNIFAEAGLEAISGTYLFSSAVNANQLLCLWDNITNLFVLRPLGTLPTTGIYVMQIVINFDVAEIGEIFLGDGS